MEALWGVLCRLALMFQSVMMVSSFTGLPFHMFALVLFPSRACLASGRQVGYVYNGLARTNTNAILPHKIG